MSFFPHPGSVSPIANRANFFCESRLRPGVAPARKALPVIPFRATFAGSPAGLDGVGGRQADTEFGGDKFYRSFGRFRRGGFVAVAAHQQVGAVQFWYGNNWIVGNV
jgi:hypothetical protein